MKINYADVSREPDRQGLRALHAYGVLFYDAYTIVSQQAPMVLDLALRERFLAFYAEGVPLVRRGQKHVITELSSFESFREELTRANQRGRKGGPTGRWRLACEPHNPMSFNAGVTDLVRWARHVGLLHGQRNRAVEGAVVALRNLAAHPSGYLVDTPVRCARFVWDVAEMINRLWDERTVGGRLYAQPVTRDVIAIGWGGDDGSIVQFLPHPESDDIDQSKTYIVVLGVWDDPTLTAFDAAFERTAYPAQLLYGPARWDTAATWLRTNTPAGDHVLYLDRLFLVRRHDRGVDLPRSLEAAAGTRRRRMHRGSGTWVQADHPHDASLHVRGPGGTPNETCRGLGPCDNCHVNVVAKGPWEPVADAFDVEPASVSFVRVPPLWEM